MDKKYSISSYDYTNSWIHLFLYSSSYVVANISLKNFFEIIISLLDFFAVKNDRLMKK